MFSKAHIEYTLRETGYEKHAFEIANQEIMPGQFDALVTVSGDGLLHEVINGLLRRDDFNEFRESLTLGCVPGGSGNGIVKSLLDRAKEDYGVTEAAYRILKGQTIKVDLTEISLEYQQAKVYSILSVSWAIFADIDINSEVFRCCGPARFTVWGVWRTLFMRQYFGSLRYFGQCPP